VCPTYRILDGQERGIELRGGALALWKCKRPEVILAGPADTGKTFGGLHKLDTLLWKYPNSQAAIVRKTHKSLYGSICITYQTKVANMGLIVPYGGDKQPDRYLYPNGSIIWLGGMDNPDKVLSSERDFIYVNQAEELQEGDWETLGTRCSGRAGNAPYSQLMGDCNPGGALHWIRKRAARGVLELLTSIHQDNPELYDREGNLTLGGKARLEALQNLTGVRLLRLFKGIWATSEGAVYDMFDPSIHIVQREMQEFKYFALAMDEGYTNPAVILLVGIDADGRWHIFREFYERGKLQKDVVQQALNWFAELRDAAVDKYARDNHIADNERSAWLKYYKDKIWGQIEVIAVDASAAGLIADLRDVGLPAQAAKGRVLDGITHMQARLKVQGDNKPRLTIEPECINTINEFESYMWKPEKDEPIKENDHSMDSLRYLDNALLSEITVIENPIKDW
jgi:PBSX family phage terminase large subunit